MLMRLLIHRRLPCLKYNVSFLSLTRMHKNSIWGQNDPRLNGLCNFFEYEF